MKIDLTAPIRDSEARILKHALRVASLQAFGSYLSREAGAPLIENVHPSEVEGHVKIELEALAREAKTLLQLHCVLGASVSAKEPNED